MKPSSRLLLPLLAAALLPAAAPAQSVRVQSAVQALAQDAGEYARLNSVSLVEAMQRLRAQEESVPTTDRIAEEFRARLAGISVEHQPDYRIVVLLTGTEPVADRKLIAGGMVVPIVFRTGAVATRDELLAAIVRHQSAIRAAFRTPPGMGVDARTGHLVVLARSAIQDPMALETELGALTGVPVRIRQSGSRTSDLSLKGGTRLVGTDPADGRTYACTTGFVVTDGTRTGIVTAAHCPDAINYTDPEGGAQVPLEMIGAWGARYQDVQVHVGGLIERSLFYVDPERRALRELTSWRNRASTRVGDAVCRRGQTSGYSCSQVELVDYAPPGDLCAGPCDPVWVAVAGPVCRSGDSGGPIFNGTVAFGIVKGGQYDREGRCNHYYYMSTDFLPEGWTLLHGAAADLTTAGTRGAGAVTNFDLDQ